MKLELRSHEVSSMKLDVLKLEVRSRVKIRTTCKKSWS